MDERDLFIGALQVEDPAGRSAYLDQACGGDAALRRRVDALLRALVEAGSYLQQPAVDAATADALPGGTAADGPGTVVGPYKLLEQIGEGGMGVVFMAEQVQPVRRRVALKVLKPGMDSWQVVARFEAERQALALMDHPNIARVIDGGTTDSGRPYFVMELVRGVPVTDFCDRNRLDVRGRLGLFISVCRAVQHAHQKGVIHRDIKPSNVLVTLHDGVPVPKVIDFGIAKAVGQSLTDKTLFTAFTQMVGTPLYMSPEQAELSGLDVDTRSDVYSLGVLLYELLTGTTPLDKDRLRTEGLDEVRRLIREEEPARPSTRLSTLGHAAATVSANRASEPQRLSRQIRGELDWVVMMALEKDRSRRYESPAALAADVDRYLADEPVQACPPSALYRARKFARRNKAAILAAACVFAGCAALAASVGWTVRDRAAHRAATAGAVDEALAQAADWQARGNWPEALAAAQRADALLKAGGGDEQLRRRVRELVRELDMADRLEKIRTGPLDTKSISTGESAFRQAFQDYGLDVEGLDPGEAAERIRASPIKEQLVAGLDAWVVMTEVNRQVRERLVAAVRRADPDPWRDRLREAYLRGDRQAFVELARSIQVVEVPPATALLLGVSLHRTGDRALAVSVLRQAQRRHPADFYLNNELAHCLSRLGKTGEAVGFARAALALRPRSAVMHNNLGAVFGREGNLAEAEAAFREALRLDPQCAVAHSNLCSLLGKQGKFSEAEAEGREAVRLDPGEPEAHLNLGSSLESQHKLSEAEAEFREAIRLKPDFAEAHAGLAATLNHQGKPAAAEAEYREAVRLKPDSGRLYQRLGHALRGQAKWGDAVSAFSMSVEVEPAKAPYLNDLAWILATCANPKLRDPRRAVAIAQKAVELEPQNGVYWQTLGVARYRVGDWKGAIAALEKLKELGSPGDSMEWFPLAMARWKNGDKDEARQLYDRAVQWMEKNAPQNDQLLLFRAEAETVLELKK